VVVAAALLGACAPVLTGGVVTAAGQSDAVAALPSQTGLASWYGPKFAGRRTSNGEIFDPSQLTAAHRTLPFGTLVRVTNLVNGRSVVVRINDRGPFKPGRIIDLSRAAADAVGMTRMGVANVRLEPLSLPSGTLRVAASARLRGYEVVSRFHAIGQLLVLAPGAGGDPVVVRVVGQNVPTESGADVLVAGTLYARLGDTVRVRSR
jgi:rare lipoprotein A